jgi:hypothetical protein
MGNSVVAHRALQHCTLQFRAYRLLWRLFVLVVCLLPFTGAYGQYSYTLTINPTYNVMTSGTAIPLDFAGSGLRRRAWSRMMLA